MLSRRSGASLHLDLCSGAIGALFSVLILTITGISCGDDSGSSEDGDAFGDGASDSRVSRDAPSPPEIALIGLVDYPSIWDRDSLDVEIQLERSGSLPGDFEDPVYQIGVRFHSQVFLGNSLYHEALLIVPSTLTGSSSGAAIIPRATSNQVETISDSPNYLPQYAAITGGRLDMPVLVLHDLPPVIDLRLDSSLSSQAAEYPQCFSGLLSDETILDDCLRELSRATGRLELQSVLPVAITQARAVTLLQDLSDRLPTIELPFDLPDFRVERVVILGSGLDGRSLRYAMALDPRIAGAYVASADIGELEAFHELQRTSWSGDYSFGTPAEEIAFLRGVEGGEFLDVYGLDAIADAITDRAYLIAVGTNDTSYPLGALGDYEAQLPEDLARLYVGDYGEGFGTPDHLQAWRAFLAHIFRDRSWAEISSTWEDVGGNIIVTAQIEVGGLLNGVSLWYVHRHSDGDDLDYRDGVWRSATMESTGDGTYTGQFSSLGMNTAYFVRISDSQDIFDGVQTGPVELIAR